MAIAVDLMIGSTMGQSGRLRDEMLSRMESLAAAGEPISAKQIAMDLCSDTPPDELAGMMLEIAPWLLYTVGTAVITTNKAFRQNEAHRRTAFSDGSKVDIERIDYSVVVPGYD